LGRETLSYFLAAASLLGLLVLSACQKASSSDQEQSTIPASSVEIVPVVKATRADMHSDLVLTAEFEPFQEVDVMAKVAGYVKQIKVDIGDRVQEGQLLAVLEVPEMEDDLARAAAAIEQADAELSTASDELRRAESTHDLAHLSYNRILAVSKREPGLVPQQEVDEAHSRDLGAEAQVAAAKSSLRASEQRTRVARAEKARLETLRRYTAITAPFTGVVTKRYANTGAMIQAGTASQTQAMPVVRLSQNNLLRLILPAPESAVPRIHVGQFVNVRVPSLGKTFPGRVARFANKVQAATRTMETEVDVPNPALTLVPGMYAEVNLRIEERRNALAVPTDALERVGDRARVYVVAEAGIIRFVPVTLGLETPQGIEIRSGLEDGEAVVVGRHAGLKEGQKVQSKLLEAAVHQTSTAPLR